MLDESLAEIAEELATEFAPDDNTKRDNSEGETPQTSKSAARTHSVLVSPKQRGNPLLKSICNVPWEYDDIVPDYQMGRTTCALFLSLRQDVRTEDFASPELLVDVSDPHHLLKNLTRVCILADLTLILAWSAEEAGKIIETYKIYENKPADNIMEKGESSPYIRLLQVLTSIKPINKTDAMNLIARFKTLEGVIKATEFQLSECPGLGPVKARKLYSTLHEKFCRN
ncbi:DNA excision repair protein ERCC-1-like Protein [Tribolium castaneum]|uniref:DNA excision repair protein ERCC-1-like Protein n=1 Tax=Tribolium castaneum TaxID=7070 RepID=D6X4D6_TRICA|nr:DNA excision repair protein ERCC-1-like Protein [Tribolium castaneum]